MQKTNDVNPMSKQNRFSLGKIFRAVQEELETIRIKNQQRPDNWYK